VSVSRTGVAGTGDAAGRQRGCEPAHAFRKRRGCWPRAAEGKVAYPTPRMHAQVVLAEDGGSASAHSNLGNVHLQTGRPALALQDFDTAVSLAPEARARRAARRAAAAFPLLLIIIGGVAP